MWKVTATGAITGATYIYRVDAPADATSNDVLCSAYGAHGAALRAGERDEPLAPGGTAEHVG